MLICINYINMYKYNKIDNMTKELVWSSGQCFLKSLERLGFKFWLLQFALCRMSMINKKINFRNLTLYLHVYFH